MNIIEKLNGKRVLLWGYGREGKSSERFINEHCSVKELKIFANVNILIHGTLIIINTI